MNLDDYQKVAGRTDKNHDEDYYVHLLSAESGEVAALFQKIRHGRALDTMKLMFELGDVMWAVARIAAKHGLSLKHIALMNILKLKWRHGNKGFNGNYKSIQ